MKNNFIQKFFSTHYTILFLASALFMNTGCTKKKEEKNDALKTYEWKMVTSWPPNFPILGKGANRIAQRIEEMSNGQLKIRVYGANELIPALGVFDAVSEGTVEMGHSAAYYWTGKIPEAVFFATIPFGLLGSQMDAWMLGGNGLKLWREIYAKQNLVPFMAGNSGVQMGGWFRKKINTLQDLNGLKMRMPGLGGKVIAAVGGSAITVAAGEIYTNLERGVIDATEWIGPYHDTIMGLDKIADYYYYPGWHEPGTQFELTVNKKAYDELPAHLQKIIEEASHATHLWARAQFEARNAEAFTKLKEEGKVKIMKFSPEIIQALKTASNKVMAQHLKDTPSVQPVYDDFIDFKNKINLWYDITEANYRDWK